MLNLNLCLECKHCGGLNRAVFDEHCELIHGSYVLCQINVEYLDWKSRTPEECPFFLEHLMSMNSNSV
jgi:hypothetical protein